MTHNFDFFFSYFHFSMTHMLSLIIKIELFMKSEVCMYDMSLLNF